MTEKEFTLQERLRATANMINMGERVAWGWDTALMWFMSDLTEATVITTRTSERSTCENNRVALKRLSPVAPIC